MKIIKKYWGVVLVIVLLSTMFVAAPASAAEPLRWENKTDTPISLFNLLAPGTDVVDFAVSGATMYAVTKSYRVTAVTTLAYNGTAGQTQTYTFTYTNQDNVAGQIGTVVFADNAALGAAGTITLAAGDTGVTASQLVNGTRTGSVGATAAAGTWSLIASDGVTVLATYTFAAVAGVAPIVNAAASAVYQSAMGGAMWTNITPRLMTAALAPIFAGGIDYVAIAPDNPAVVVVASANPAAGTPAGTGAAITDNAGLTFTSMGVIQDGTFTNTAATISGIDISQTVAGGFRYIAIYGVDSATFPALYYYNFGTGVGSWKNACSDFTGVINAIPDSLAAAAYTANAGEVVAFEFSPLFQGDYMGVAVIDDAVVGVLELHEVSFNANGNWDTEAGYPVAVYTDSGAAPFTAIAKVSLTLSPGYDGSDESSRVAFIGTDLTDSVLGVIGGIFRAVDTSVGQIYGAVTPAQIWSVSFDGTNLAAGMSVTNNVVRSTNALASTPSFASARNYKKIGTADIALADMVVVKYADGVLYGAKSGTGSCMSKSADYGNTWSDFTLIDDNYQVGGAIDDIYMTASGDPWYMSTSDGNTSNVYRIAGFGVTRILCVPTGPAFSLRGLDANADLLYAADTAFGGTAIYYTATAGLTRWDKRTSPAPIADLAVDSTSTVFVGGAFTTSIYKSTNTGFTWSAAVNSGLIVMVNNLFALGDGKIVAGGIVGDVVYSTNGGANWSFTMGAWAAPALISASGLGEGDYLFAASTASSAVYRCLLGSGNPSGAWQNMNTPQWGAETNTGIVFKSGVLYTIANDAVGLVGPPIVTPKAYINRTNLALIPMQTFGGWSTTYSDAAQRFADVDALAASIANNVFTLYAINTTAVAVRYFQDTLALASPVLTGPADGALIQLSSALLGASQAVTFTWNKVSLATNYLLFIAQDELFTQPIGVSPVAVASTAPMVASIVAGNNFNPGNTYYWRVMVLAPLSSGFSETRSFVIQPTAASVPSIGSPSIGAVVQPGNASFSWSPIAGTTSYTFQLDTGTSFTAPLYAATATGAGIDLPATVNLERGRTYFWRVKALTPTEGDWSTIANFSVAEEVTTSATTTVTPTTTTQTTITIPPATSTIITVPPATTTVNEVNPTYIWAIIIIGAVLVLAVIVLIVRTRRSV